MSVDDEGHGNLSLFEPDDFPDGAPRRRRIRRSARPDVQIRRSRRRRLRGRIVPLIAVAIIVVVVVSGYTIVRHFLDGFAVKDYQGSGSGIVVVHVTDGSTTGAIATLLVKDDVVASTKAFENAAGSKQFQAGYFKMRRQMSGQSAVALLLLPSSRLVDQGDDPGRLHRDGRPGPLGHRAEAAAGHPAEGRGPGEPARYPGRFHRQPLGRGIPVPVDLRLPAESLRG